MGLEDPFLLLFQHSSKCGLQNKNMMNPALALCTENASKFLLSFLLKKLPYLTDQVISLYNLPSTMSSLRRCGKARSAGWSRHHCCTFSSRAVPVCALKHFLASPVGYLYERGDRSINVC